MAYSPRIEISASKAIAHMRHRLSAEQTASIEVRFKRYQEIDKMIEHMRSRLKPSFQQQARGVFHQSYNLVQVRNPNLDLISMD